MARQIASALTKAADYDSRIEGALEAVDWDWRELIPKAEPYLAGVAVAAGEDAVSELGLFDDEVLARMRVKATAYAADRAAELVGGVRHGELILPNPAPEWTVADATRDMVREVVGKGLKEGWSSQQLAREIRGSAGFSAARAETIARTELAAADVQGTLAGWKESGLVAGKQWLTAPGCCDVCHQINGAIVAINDNFPIGDPPAHPRCRCTVIAVLEDELPKHGEAQGQAS